MDEVADQPAELRQPEGRPGEAPGHVGLRPDERQVPAGGWLIAPAVTRLLIAEFADLHPPPRPATALEGLTAREVEVLELVARGELQLRDRVHAVICAYDAGLVTPGARG
jgi:hypothetical protein